MKAQFQLGCLRHSEREQLNPLFYDNKAYMRWTESYACMPTAIEIPEEGTSKEDVRCPICERRVQLKLSSPSRLANELLIVLMVWATLLFGVGFATYFAGPADAGLSKILMTLAFGGGSLALIPAVIFAVVHPRFMNRLAVTIHHDEVLDNQVPAQFSDRRRHKIFAVEV